MIKPFRKNNREFIAYNAEKNFLDKMSELGENLFSKGTVAKDTLEIGDLKLHWALQSPLKIQNNGETTTVSFTGGTSVEVGITMKNGSSGGDYSGTNYRDANPFYDPSNGSSGEGNGHERRPRG